MDYIITDETTSPLDLAYAYTEKLAYMPHTFFIGDHAQMLKHLTERVVLKDRNSGSDTPHRDTVTVINATNLQPLLDKVEVTNITREAEVACGPDKELKKTTVNLPVLEIPTTEPVKQMIGSGMIAASVEGVAVQNGLTTLNQVKNSEIFKD